MTCSMPDWLLHKSKKLLFDGTRVLPDQFFIWSDVMEVVALIIPFSSNSPVGMTDDFAIYIVNRVELVATRGRNKIDVITAVNVLPYGGPWYLRWGGLKLFDEWFKAFLWMLINLPDPGASGSKCWDCEKDYEYRFNHRITSIPMR